MNIEQLKNNILNGDCITELKKIDYSKDKIIDISKQKEYINSQA